MVLNCLFLGKVHPSIGIIVTVTIDTIRTRFLLVVQIFNFGYKIYNFGVERLKIWIYASYRIMYLSARFQVNLLGSDKLLLLLLSL